MSSLELKIPPPVEAQASAGDVGVVQQELECLHSGLFPGSISSSDFFRVFSRQEGLSLSLNRISDGPTLFTFTRGARSRENTSGAEFSEFLEFSSGPTKELVKEHTNVSIDHESWTPIRRNDGLAL